MDGGRVHTASMRNLAAPVGGPRTAVAACYMFFPVVPICNIGPLFGVSVITHTRHTVGLLWTSDQSVAETSTYTGQHNI
jgi:hypothetical protein